MRFNIQRKLQVVKEIAREGKHALWMAVLNAAQFNETVQTADQMKVFE